MLNGTEVLLVNDEDRLEFRRVTVLRTEPESVIVSAGLKNGERVVVTPPSTPTPKARVRVIDVPEKQPGEGEENSTKPGEVATAS